VHVFYGPMDESKASMTEDGVVYNSEEQSLFGEMVNMEGDLDGDGIAELVIADCAGCYDPNDPGRTTAADVRVHIVSFPPVGWYDVKLNSRDALYGSRRGLASNLPFSAGGDLNGDGIDDFAMFVFNDDTTSVFLSIP